jgi:hypothetical protein
VAHTRRERTFKVSYDRASGYIGYKVSGDEFKVECTKFDKLLLVFKDGHYKVTDLQEKLFVGPGLIFCAIPDREQVFTLAYSNRLDRQDEGVNGNGWVVENLPYIANAEPDSGDPNVGTMVVVTSLGSRVPALAAA